MKQPGSLGEQVKTLFRTPCAAEVDGGPLTPEQAKERGQTLRLAGQVEAEFGDLRTLPTPRVSSGNGVSERELREGDPKARLEVSAALLPTPDAYAGERGGTQHPDKRREGGHSVSLGDVVEHQTSEVDFGDYTAAVQRWEAVTGRPAPAPTKPNPKTGRQQLSAGFAEWMMGLPAGWITSPTVGLSRQQQFRIAGNGVVPQQGHAALTAMLDTALTEEGTCTGHHLRRASSR